MILHIAPVTAEKFRWDWTLQAGPTIVARGPARGFTTSEGAAISVAKMLGGLYAPASGGILRRGPAVGVVIHDAPRGETDA